MKISHNYWVIYYVTLSLLHACWCTLNANLLPASMPCGKTLLPNMEKFCHNFFAYLPTGVLNAKRNVRTGIDKSIQNWKQKYWKYWRTNILLMIYLRNHFTCWKNILFTALLAKPTWRLVDLKLIIFSVLSQQTFD